MQQPHAIALGVLMDRAGDFPVAFAEHGLQRFEKAQVGLNLGQRPLRLERGLHPLKIAGRVMHIGLGHVDINEADSRVQPNVAHFRPFAHHLAVDLAFRRDVDDQIAFDRGLAPKPPPIDQAALLPVAFFH